MSKWPELLQDLADQTKAQLVALGIQAALAERVGIALAKHLRKHWGGAQLYVPKALAIELSWRDEAIRHRYHNGRSVAELAREYGVSDMRIYQILQACRAARRCTQGTGSGGCPPEPGTDQDGRTDLKGVETPLKRGLNAR